MVTLCAITFNIHNCVFLGLLRISEQKDAVVLYSINWFFVTKTRCVQRAVGPDSMKENQIIFSFKLSVRVYQAVDKYDYFMT